MIVYSIVARTVDGIVLAEATTLGLEGNHPQITRELIATLQGNPTLVPIGNRKTFVYHDDITSNIAPMTGGKCR